MTKDDLLHVQKEHIRFIRLANKRINLDPNDCQQWKDQIYASERSLKEIHSDLMYPVFNAIQQSKNDDR